jgi:hypothetical protein
MKFLVTICFTLFFTTAVTAQSISYEDFKTILPLLQKEDFKKVFEKTNHLLANTIDDSSEMRGIVNYMNIFSAAGMVTLRKMTHADFLKNAKRFIGQRLVMAGHPCMDSSGTGFNTLRFETTNGQVRGHTASTNIAATAIFCFEEFKYATPVNPKDFIGLTVRCGGILENVEVNPNNSLGWISRLFIKEAFIRSLMPQ